jgi:NAD(P)-dependent dehydrogenase (short-subunit alcohol dehydrogenase family)
MLFTNKTVFVTGASRGIGKAIALRLAAEGANIIVVAKSVVENAKLGGTIFSAAKEIEDAGGKALAVPCDIRFEEQIKDAVDKAVNRFGGIDIVINNASAINLSPTEQTEPKRFDLIHDINVRGTFFCNQGLHTAFEKFNKCAYTYLIATHKPGSKMAGRACCLYHFQIQHEHDGCWMGSGVTKIQYCIQCVVAKDHY